MKGFALGLSLAVAFIIGCVSAPLIVPRMSAQQQAAGVQRWEYLCAAPSSRHQVHAEILNELGREGWDFSHVSFSVFCFKRPL